VSLRTSIVGVLTRARGAKMELRDIASRLGMDCGNEGEPWQNVCKIAEELGKMEAREEIRASYGDGKSLHWIERVRDDKGVTT
jgi:hypothetical protein